MMKVLVELMMKAMKSSMSLIGRLTSLTRLSTSHMMTMLVTWEMKMSTASILETPMWSSGMIELLNWRREVSLMSFSNIDQSVSRRVLSQLWTVLAIDTRRFLMLRLEKLWGMFQLTWLMNSLESSFSKTASFHLKFEFTVCSWWVMLPLKLASTEDEYLWALHLLKLIRRVNK